MNANDSSEDETQQCPSRPETHWDVVSVHSAWRSCTHTHTHNHTLLHISWGRESTTELWHTHAHTHKNARYIPTHDPIHKGLYRSCSCTHTHTHSDNIPALTLSHITFSSHTHTHTDTQTHTHTHTLRRSIPLCLPRQNESEEAAASHLQMGSGLSEDFQRGGNSLLSCGCHQH